MSKATSQLWSNLMVDPIDPREREFWNSVVADYGGDVLGAVARTLKLWAAVNPGGSYADQCQLMATDLIRIRDQVKP